VLKGRINVFDKLRLKTGDIMKSGLRKIVQKQIEEEITKEAGGKIVYFNYFRRRHPIVCFAVCV
jgi:hypothetical protein